MVGEKAVLDQGAPLGSSFLENLNCACGMCISTVQTRTKSGVPWSMSFAFCL